MTNNHSLNLNESKSSINHLVDSGQSLSSFRSSKKKYNKDFVIRKKKDSISLTPSHVSMTAIDQNSLKQNENSIHDKKLKDQEEYDTLVI